MSEQDKKLMAEYGITSTVKEGVSVQGVPVRQAIRCAQLCPE